MQLYHTFSFPEKEADLNFRYISIIHLGHQTTSVLKSWICCSVCQRIWGDNRTFYSWKRAHLANLFYKYTEDRTSWACLATKAESGNQMFKQVIQAIMEQFVPLMCSTDLKDRATIYPSPTAAPFLQEQQLHTRYYLMNEPHRTKLLRHSMPGKTLQLRKSNSVYNLNPPSRKVS